MRIDPKFKSLIPPLSVEEFSQLEENILKDGCRDPLVIWGDVLIDGHNRYDICTKHDLGFATVQQQFDSEADAEIWIIRNQFGRRNLTPFVRGELALKLKPLLAEKAKGNQRLSEGRGKKGIQTSGNLNSEPVRTDKELASVAGVSHDTMHKIGIIAEKAPDEVKEALRLGETTVNAEYKKLTNFITKNSAENEWYTPPVYIEAARKAMRGIDLDPATSEVAQQVVKAKRYFTAEDDGLSKAWSGRVWLNPPYSKDLVGLFCDKLLQSLAENGGKVNSAIMLTNNATDTQWFHSVSKACSSICFVQGRISFLDSTGEPRMKPLQGQIFLYFGDDTDSFTQAFSEFGVCLYQ